MTTLISSLHSVKHRVLWIPAVVVVVCYLPALGAALVWDDLAFLRDTAVYRDPNLWPSAIFAPFVIAESYFRPLPLFTFAIQMQMTGIAPLPLHLLNLCIHGLNTLLLTLYIFKLRPRTLGAALAGGLLYGLHPALVESAVFVSSRFDLMVTTFCLLAVSATRWDIQEDAKTVVVALSFFAAAFSKEMAVTLPAVLLILQHNPGEPLMRSVKSLLTRYRARYSWILGAGVLYLLIRRASLGTLTGHVSTGEMGLADAVLLVLRSIGEYLRLIVFPFGGIAPLHVLETPLRWLPVLASVAGLVFAAVLIRRLNDVSRVHATAGLIALLPVINILPLSLSDSFVAERFLTFPLALIIAGVATCLPVDFSPRKHVKLTIPVVGFLAASVVTIQLTLPKWESRDAFWEWARRTAPESETVWTNLSRLRSEEGDFASALDAAVKAVEVDPESHEARNNLGMAYAGIGNQNQARDAFQLAIQRDPSIVTYWSNLAMALSASGQHQEALRILTEEALARDPHHPLANLNASAAFLNAGRPDKSVDFLQRAERYLQGPNTTYTVVESELKNPARWLNLAKTMIQNAEWERAQTALGRAAELGASTGDTSPLRDRISAGMNR